MRIRFAFMPIAMLFMAMTGQAVGLSVVGNIPHVAWGMGWQTALFLSNYGTSDANVVVNTYDDNGSALSAPWTSVFAGQSGVTGAPVTSLNITLKAGQIAVFAVTGVDTSVFQGSAQVLSDVATINGGVDFKYDVGTLHGEGMAMFDQSSAKMWDLLYFAQTQAANCSYANEFTSYAIANTTASQVTFTRTIADRITGVQQYSDQVTLGPHGHMSFIGSPLPSQGPALGSPSSLWMMRVTAPAAGQLALVTLHFRQDVAPDIHGACVSGTEVFESVPNWVLQ